MNNEKKVNENMIEGRNAVLEAFRSGKPIDKLYVLDGCQDGPVRTIVREARKTDVIINYVDKGEFATYWANTSSNSLVGKLIREGE